VAARAARPIAVDAGSAAGVDAIDARCESGAVDVRA